MYLEYVITKDQLTSQGEVQATSQMLRSICGDEIASFPCHFVLDYSIRTPVDQLWTTFKSKCLEMLEMLEVSRWSSECFSQPCITGQVKHITRSQSQTKSETRLNAVPNHVALSATYLPSGLQLLPEFVRM